MLYKLFFATFSHLEDKIEAERSKLHTSIIVSSLNDKPVVNQAITIIRLVLIGQPLPLLTIYGNLFMAAPSNWLSSWLAPTITIPY